MVSENRVSCESLTYYIRNAATSRSRGMLVDGRPKRLLPFAIRL